MVDSVNLLPMSSIGCNIVLFQLSMFRLLPARPLSRAWGNLASYELPVWLRRPVLGVYVWAFGCRMDEAVVEDVASYQSLVQLFTRRLKHGARSVSSQHDLVSIKNIN